MMDFKLIMILVGLALLVLVSLFALLGFFGGIKREWKCTAVAFVLVILAMLVFGDSSLILNMKGGFLKGMLSGIPDSAETVWDCIVGYVRNQVENGAVIFAEGTKAYAFLYNVVAGIARGAALVVGVFVIMVIVMIANGIYRLVAGIHGKKVKKQKAALASNEEEKADEPTLSEGVLVSSSTSEGDVGSVVATSKKADKKGDGNYRGWAAFIAGVRAIIVIIILFAPIAGVCTVLNEVTPETEGLIRDLMNGSNSKTADEEADVIDLVMDFKDAYYESVTGKAIESSAKFFKESFSTKLFDSAFCIKTESGKLTVRKEIIVLVDAVNQLEGNIKLNEITEEEFSNALDALKDSELLVEIMPVVIEVGYNYPLLEGGKTLGDLLKEAGTQAEFLALKNADWDKNLETILDAAKYVKELGVLDGDFNPLTMDPATLGEMLDTLIESDVIESVLNIAVETALNSDAILDKIGVEKIDVDMSNFDWKSELEDIVNIYDEFQDLGITSLNDLDLNETIKDIINDEEKFDTVSTIISDLFDTQLMNDIGIQVGLEVVANLDVVKDAGTDLQQQVKDLANIDWANDVPTYLEAVKEALDFLDFSEGLVPKVDYLHMDPEALQDVVDKLFETESFEEILPIATNIALNQEKVKELIGEDVTIDTANINWEQDFTKLVDVYDEFLKLEINDIKDVTSDPLAFAKEVLADEAKTAALEAILDSLAETDIFADVATPVVESIANKKVNELLPDASFALDLSDMTVDEWKEDFEAIVEALSDVEEFCGLEFNDLSGWDFSEDGIDALQEAVEDILTLNVLGDDANKTGLVEGVLNKVEIFSEEQLDMIDLSDVVWANEIENIQELIEVVGELQNTEGFDLTTKEFDFNELLQNDEFIDTVIDALDVVVDSDLLMDIAPAAIDKFVKPAIEGLDDEDGTINGILDTLTTEELVGEVQKLMEVARAAGQLNVLAVKDEGLDAIDWANTEALHTIIDGIFDSKIIEGNEGRVIRILLKATGILEVEKGALDNIDYDNEQAILNKAIDDLDEVLKDERFLEFDENGKLVISYGLYTSQKTLNSFFAALERLFGVWTPSSETDGSELVKALLPEAYDKYIKDMIPASLADVIDYMGLDEATGDELMSDVRHIIYVGKVAVNAEMANYLTENDYDFSHVDTAVGQILYAVFDMHCVKGNEAELVAYALNKAIEVAKLDMDEVTAESLGEVDWPSEVDALTKLVSDVVKLLAANDLATVEKVTDFVKSNGWKESSYITNENVLAICDILEDIVALQTVETVLPIALVYGCNLAYEKGYNVDYLTRHVTKEDLVEDLKSIIELARIAVTDIGLVDYYKNNWSGELCEVEAIEEALEILFNLNLVHGNEDDLLELAFSFVPENNYVKASDLDFFYFTNHKETEIEALEGVLEVLFDFFEVNNIHKLEDVMALVKEQWYLDIDNLLKDYNVEIASSLVEAISESDLVVQCIKVALPTLLDMPAITNILDASCIAEISKEELKEDLVTVASIISEVNKLDIASVYATKDLEPIDTLVIKNVLNMVGELNIVNNYASKLVPQAVNYVIGKTSIDIGKTFTEADFADVNWANEFSVIGNTIEKAVQLAEKNNLDSLQDIIKFAKNGDFKDPLVYTADNAVGLIDVLSVALDSQIIKALSVVAVDWAIDFAVEKGIEIGFLKGRLTADDLISDLDVLLQIANDLIDFGLVEYANTGEIDGIEVLPLVDAVSLFEELNILTCANKEWTNLVVNMLNDKVMSKYLDYTLETSVEKYAAIDYAKENQVLQNFVHEIGYLLRNLDLTKATEVIDFVKNIKDNATNVAIYNNRTTKNVAEMLNFIASSDIVKLYIVDLFNFGVDKASTLTNQDLSFLKNSVTADELENDIQVLGSMRDALLDFDLPRLIITGDVKEIKTSYIADCVAKLEDMYIFTNNNDAIASFAYNKIADILGISKKSANDFNTVDWAAENALLCDIIEEAQNLLDAEGFKTVADIKEFVNGIKFYSRLRSTYNDDAIEAVENIVILACDSQAIKAGLVDLFDSAVKWATLVKNIDLSFLEGEFTADELTSDIKVVIDIVNGVLDFGLLEILETYDLSDIDTTPIQNVIPLLENINVLEKHNADWAAFVNNFVKPILKDKFNITISEKEASDFAAIDFAAENAALVTIIDCLEDVLRTAGCTAFHDVKDLINDYAYKTKEFYTNEVCHAIIDLVNAIDNSEIFAAYLPELLNVGLTYVPSEFDVSFLKDAFTADELQADVHKLCEIAGDLVDLGIVEVIFDKKLSVIDAEGFANVVAKFEEVNILTTFNKEFTALAYNFVASLLALDKKEAADYDDVVYADENQLLQDALLVIGEFLEAENLVSSDDVIDWAKNFDYKKLVSFTDARIDFVEELAVIASDSKILSASIVELFDLGVKYGIDKGFELEFLLDEFFAIELSEDIKTLCAIVDEIQLSNIKECLLFKTIEDLEVSHLANAITLLEELYVLRDVNREWAAFANNTLKPILKDKLGIELEEKTAADYALINFPKENAVLSEVVVLIKDLLDAANVVTYDDALAIYTDKEYMNTEFYTNAVVDALFALINGIDNSDIFASYLPALFNYGVSKVPFSIDVSFLEDKFSAEELQADVHTICDIADKLIDLGVLEIALNKEIGEISAKGYASVVPMLEDVNILTKVNKEWTALVYNLVAEKLGVPTKEAADFNDVTYADENQLLVDGLMLVDKLSVMENLKTVDAYKNWITKFNFTDPTAYYDDLVDVVEDILTTAIKSNILKVAIPDLFDKVVTDVDTNKGIKIGFLANKFTADELISDVYTLIEVIDEVQASGIIDVVSTKDLDDLHMNNVTNIISMLEEINILEKCNADWAALVYNKLAEGTEFAEKTASDFAGVDFANENALLVSGLQYAYDLANALGISTIDEAKDYDYKSLAKLDSDTNNYVKTIATIIDIASSSDLLAEFAFPAAARFVPSSLAGLADIQNIYSSPAELRSDLADISVALMDVVSLHLDFVVQYDEEIPFDETAKAREIFENLLGLNYLNGPGRVEKLLTLVGGIDTSSINPDNIDLASDGVLLADAYDELAKILTDDLFPIKKLSDTNSKVSIDINYWMQQEYLDAAKDAFDNIMNTTLVKETNGAILLVCVPLLRVFFPDYYDAIAPEECSVEELSEDFETITNIVHDLLDAEWDKISDGKVFIASVKTLIDNTLTNIKSLNMTYGDAGAIIKCTLDRFDYKKVNGFEIYSNEWDTSHINFQNDIDVLLDMVDAIYNFCYAENIVYITDLKTYFGNLASNVKDELSKDIVLDTVEAIAHDVTKLSIVKFDSLQAYTLVKRSGKVALLDEALFDLTGLYGSSVELNLDLVHVANIISLAKEIGLASILSGDEINYDQADKVQALIAEFTSMVYVNAKFVDIFNKVDSLVSSVNFTDYVDPTEIDVVNDFAILGEIYEVLVPALMSDNNDYKTLSTSVTLYKEHLTNLVYSYQHALVEAIDLAAEITVAPGLVKLFYSKYDEKIPSSIKDYVDVLNIDAIEDEILRNDLHILADVLEDLASTTILGYALFGYDVDLSDKDAYTKLVEDLFKLYMIDNNVRPLLSKLCDNYNIDGVYLGGIDYEAEEAMIVDLVGNALEVLYALDLYTLSDVVAHYTALVDDVKAGINSAKEYAKAKHIKTAIKDALRPVVRELRNMDVECGTKVVDDLLSLQLVKAFGLPLYNKYVVEGRTGLTGKIVKLEGYTDEMFASDIDTIKSIVDSIVDSKIYEMLETKALPGTEAIPYLEDAVRAFCNLNVLNIKVAEGGEIGQALLEKFGLVDKIEDLVHVTIDLTKYDWTEINFAADADQYAAMVQYAYVALDELLHTGLKLSYFGDETAMQAVAEIYALAMETSLGEFATDRIISVVAKFAPKAHCSVTADNDVIRANTADFLFGLVEIGFFSNNGIDLTNTAVVNSLKNDITESINLPGKVQSLLNKVCGRAYCYGVIPFTWETADLRTELKIAKDAAKKALDLAKANASSITSLDFSFLADAANQAKVEEVADKLAESALLSQLVFPVIDGTYKALTLSVNGSLVYDTNMTVEELFDNCFNDLWNIVNNVNAISGLNLKNINVDLFKFDEFKAVLHTVVNNCMLEGNGNIGNIIAVACTKVVKLDLTDEQVDALIAIDYTADTLHFENAIDILKDTYNIHGFSYNASILKDAVAAKGFADAIKEILNSEVVKVVLRTLVSKLVESKLPSVDDGIYNFVSNRLADTAYTDTLLTNDLVAICDLLDDLANTDILSNNADIAAWDYTAVKSVVNGFFNLNMVVGHENDIMKPAIKKVPTICDYYSDSMAVADWKTELLTIISGLESLVNDGIADMSNIDITSISGTTIEYLCDSVIISSVVLDTINDNLSSSGISYTVTKADLDAVTDWDNELATINTLIDVADMSPRTNEAIKDAFDACDTTVLCKKILGFYASTLLPSVPFVDTYIASVDTSSWTATDWYNELGAVLNCYEKASTIGASDLSLPLENLAGHGDVPAAAVQSVILKQGMISELGTNINSAFGAGLITITESDIDAIGSTAADWNNELAKINALKTALDNLASDPMNVTYITEAANAADDAKTNSVIGKKIAEAKGF